MDCQVDGLGLGVAAGGPVDLGQLRDAGQWLAERGAGGSQEVVAVDEQGAQLVDGDQQLAAYLIEVDVGVAQQWCGVLWVHGTGSYSARAASSASVSRSGRRLR